MSSRLNSWKVVLIVLAGFVVQGCAAFTGVEPSDLEPILVGKTRADVEAVLGEPVERTVNGCGEVDTYRYDRGSAPRDDLFMLTMVHPAAPFVVGLIAHPFIVYGQKGEIDIVYDPRDTVIKYGPRDLREWDALFSRNHLWVDQTTTMDVAQQYYDIGMTGGGDQNLAWNCLCNAARLGHGQSQIQLARIQRPGQEPNREGAEMVQASYGLTVSNGFAAIPGEPAVLEIGATGETTTAAYLSGLGPQGIGACAFDPSALAVTAERGISF